MPDQAPPASTKPRARKATNVSLPKTLVAEAAALNINVSRACEAGLTEAVKQERLKRWIEENRDAIDFWNNEVETNGLPLDEFRQF